MSLLKVNTVQTDKLQSVAGVNRNSVLQVVNQTISELQVINTLSWTDTVITASITPTSATSKILVLFNPSIVLSISGNATGAVGLRLKRDSTVIFSPYGETASGPFSFGQSSGGSTSAVSYGNFLIKYMDSPSTTSEVTYTMQGANYLTSTLAFYINYQASTYNQQESSVTLMEIAQ